MIRTTAAGPRQHETQIQETDPTNLLLRPAIHLIYLCPRKELLYPHNRTRCVLADTRYHVPPWPSSTSSAPVPAHCYSLSSLSTHDARPFCNLMNELSHPKNEIPTTSSSVRLTHPPPCRTPPCLHLLRQSTAIPDDHRLPTQHDPPTNFDPRTPIYAAPAALFAFFRFIMIPGTSSISFPTAHSS